MYAHAEKLCTNEKRIRCILFPNLLVILGYLTFFASFTYDYIFCWFIFYLYRNLYRFVDRFWWVACVFRRKVVNCITAIWSPIRQRQIHAATVTKLVVAHDLVCFIILCVRFCILMFYNIFPYVGTFRCLGLIFRGWGWLALRGCRWLRCASVW